MTDRKGSPAGHDLLIFLPTYNEKGNVPEIIARIRKLPFPADILFIDDNSPDGTGELLSRLCQQETDIAVMHRKIKSGIGSAHREALLYACEKRYKRLITMDADLTHDPGDIPLFLEQGGKAAVVVGSRFLPGAVDKRGWREKAASRFSHTATSLMLGLPYDVTSAFRLYRLDVIDPAVFARIETGGYDFLVESLYTLEKSGVRIAESPVRLSRRISGRSKMRFLDIVRWIARLLAVKRAGSRNLQ